jgi:hypothetical protein
MPRKQTTNSTTAKKTTTTRKKTTASARTRSKKMTLVNPIEINSKIREKAYELYEKRGGWHGADLEDWVRAEKEVKKELSHA